jgi:hypothetical protein
MIYWLQRTGRTTDRTAHAKTDIDGNAWLTEHSPIPIIGDEAVQRFADVDKPKAFIMASISNS